MAAREDQAQPVVGDPVVVRFLRLGRRHLEPLRQHAERRVEAGAATQAVDRLEPARRDQPGARLVRHAVARPAFQRGRERVVHRLLGEVEVAEQADQGGEDAARVGAVEGVYHLAQPVGRVLAHQGSAATAGRTP
jgi:hypothetical protein